MSQEIEKKYRLSGKDAERLEEDLRVIGAEFVESRDEVNRIYSGELLSRNASVMRIRTTEHGSTLTFKKWIPGEGDLKRHLELETGIDDPADAAEILAQLGLKLVLVYEKRRRVWKVRESEVVLDELPFGVFMEIEGTPASIREAEMILEAEKLQPEPLTYPRLTEKHGTRVDGVIEARFE